MLHNLACQWRAFRCFSFKYRIFDWPVKEHTLCLFGQYLAYTFHSSGAVRNYLSGVIKVHILLRAEPLSMKDIEVRLTLQGLNKTMLTPVHQAQPMTPEILLDLVLYLDLTKRRDLALWGVLVVGFFTFFHKSNLIPDKAESFSASKQLSQSAVTFEDDIAVLHVTWSKTIQYKQRVVEVPLFPIEGSPLCPVTTLKALLQLKDKSTGPLFSVKKGTAWTYYMFQKRFKALMKKAGYDSSAFSSHSLRRGGSLWAFRSGVLDSLIQVQGDWTSDSYKRYFSFAIEVRAVVNMKMRKAIQE